MREFGSGTWSRASLLMLCREILAENWDKVKNCPAEIWASASRGRIITLDNIGPSPGMEKIHHKPRDKRFESYRSLVTSSRPSWDSNSGGIVFSFQLPADVSDGQTRQFQWMSLVTQTHSQPLIGLNLGTDADKVSDCLKLLELRLCFIVTNIPPLSSPLRPGLELRTEGFVEFWIKWEVTPKHHQEMWLKWVRARGRDFYFTMFCY